MTFSTELQHSNTLKSLALNIIDNDIHDIVSFLRCMTCGDLDHLSCSGMFSLISTKSGRKMEIKSTKYFNKISQVMQLLGTEVCKIVVSNDSATDLSFTLFGFWFKHIKGLLKSLEKNSRVTSLRLLFNEHSIQQSSAFSQALENMLKVNKKITILRLWGYIDDNISEELVKGLCFNHSLQQISVEVTHLKDKTVLDLLRSVEFTNISKVIFHPKYQLSRPSRSRWIFKHDTAVNFLNFLNFFCSSICLMRESQIINCIFCGISEVLKIDCTIDETLAISLFNAFEHNPVQIRVLDLSQSGAKIKDLGDNASKALENMLRKNFTLQCLKLNDNINDSMAYAIARGVLHNHSLQTLDLNVTCLTDDALTELLQSFSKTNLTITCRPNYLQHARLVRVFSALEQDVDFNDGRERSHPQDGSSSNSFLRQALSAFFLSSTHTDKPVNSCALEKIFHNMRSLNTCGLRELVISSSKHFLSSVVVRNGVKNLLINLASMKVLKFCNPVTLEVIEGLSRGLKRNKTLSSLTINKKGLTWNEVSPILKSVNLSDVSRLEFIQECILHKELDNDCWKLEVTNHRFYFGSDNVSFKIYHEISKFKHILIDLFINDNPDDITLSLCRKNAEVTKVLQKSIGTGTYHVRKLTLIVCDDICDEFEVVIDIEEILKSKSLKTVYIMFPNSQHIANYFLEKILVSDFTRTSLTQLNIGNTIAFKRSERDNNELIVGEIVSRHEITSPWKVSIERKDVLSAFYTCLSQICRDHPLKSSLCHLVLQSLKCLDLSSAHLNYTKLTHLFGELQHDMNLTHIDLSNCSIMDELKGLSPVMQSALLELLKKNTTLQSIVLTGIVNRELTKAVATILPCCSLKSLSVNMLCSFDVVEELVCAFVNSKLNQLKFTDICLLQKDDESWCINLRDNQLQSTWQRDLFRSWSILFMLVLISRQVPCLKLSLGTQVHSNNQLQIFKMFFSSVIQPQQDDSYGKSATLNFFHSLEELHLEAHQEGITLFETVMKSLESCKSLKKLCVLHHHNLSEETLKATYKQLILSHKSLEAIDLRGAVPDSIVNGIAEELSHNITLQTLAVALLNQLVSSTTLAHLLDSFHDSNLACLHITDDCIISKDQKNCCNIEFTGNKYLRSKLFCASVKAQCCCNHLRKALSPNYTLDLSGEGAVFDNDVLAPKTLQDGSVKQLNLTQNKVDSETLSLLQLKKSTLRQLKLSNCCISDSMCEQISNELIFNSELKALKLSSNKITICGVHKLFKALANNSVLQELDLSENDIISQNGEDSVVITDSKITPLNKTISTLHLGHCDPLCECIATGLSSEVTSLKVLSLQIKNEEEIIKIFKSMVQNRSLEVLDCVGSSVSTTSIGVAIKQMLAHNSTLRHLNLCNCGISDKQCEVIAEGLAQNKHLQKLDLSSNIICDSGIVKLFQILEDDGCSLEELNLSNNWKYDEPDPVSVYNLRKILATNTKLKVLNVSELFCFSKWFGRELFNGLQRNTSLKKLNVSRNLLDEETSLALSTMLAKNESITELTIEWCTFKPSQCDIQDVAHALKTSCSLQRVICDPVTKISLKLLGVSDDIIETPIETSSRYVLW